MCATVPTIALTTERGIITKEQQTVSGEVWTDAMADYAPLKREPEKCKACGGDLILRHTCGEPLRELEDRLVNAAGTLQAMVEAKNRLRQDHNYERLSGKVEGVRLALSYLRELRA